MKILKHILLLVFVLISNNSTCHATTHCGAAEFKTGEEYWETSKLQYHLTVAGQLRERHNRYSEMDLFDTMIDLDKNNELCYPIRYSIACNEGFTLELALNPGGSAQLQLFLAFNEAMVEILDTFGELYNKAQYLRSDLKAMQGYCAEALTFLKRVEQSTGHIFKSSKGKFNEKKFLESLDNVYLTCYTEASVFNNQNNWYVQNIKNNHHGIVTTEQYIVHYVDVYLKWFTNQYIFLKAHLRSYDKKTCSQLNRKLEGGLKDFSYNLSAVNTMNSLDPGFSGKEKETFTTTTRKGNVSKNQTPNSSNNRKARRKNRNNSSAKSTVSSSNQDQSQTLVSKTEKNTDTVETLSEIVTGIETPVETNEILKTLSLNQSPLSAQQQQENNFVESTIIPSEAEEIINLSLSQELAELREKEKSYQEKEEKILTPSIFQESASKILELNGVLNEFDGGPTAGMKTRKFLKLCESLNSLGYFSDFSANEKEVKIKTNDMVTVMHTNHSGKKKNPGITNNTANKLKEVIEEIKK